MNLQTACHDGLALAGELIIDAHCHMGRWAAFNVPFGGSPEAMIQAMDRLGFRACAVAHHGAIGPDYQRGNDATFGAADAFPGRILPYVTINPTHGPAATEAEIARHEPHISGLKFHPALHESPIAHEGYLPALEYADAHRLPVLSHSWGGDLYASAAMLADLADRYRDASFLIGHSASSPEFAQESAALARTRDNLYLDLTGSRLYYGLLEKMVQWAGPERIVFGTDMPFIDPRPGLGRVLMAQISDDDKRLILGHNASRLFGL